MLRALPEGAEGVMACRRIELESKAKAKAMATTSTSHVRQTVAMSQIFIARLQEIQRVHIPHSVLSGTVGRMR